MGTTSVEHVKRILIDHDYVRSSIDEVDHLANMEKIAIVEPCAHLNNDNTTQDKYSYVDGSEIANAEERIGSGIEASDLGDLLDKFEEAISNSAGLLTPAPSPGYTHDGNERLNNKVNTQAIEKGGQQNSNKDSTRTSSGETNNNDVHIKNGSSNNIDKSQLKKRKRMSKERKYRSKDKERNELRHRRSTSSDARSSEDEIYSKKHRSLRDTFERRDKVRNNERNYEVRRESRGSCDDRGRSRERYVDRSNARRKRGQGGSSSSSKYIRDIEYERKVDFKLGRSNIVDIAKEERREIYVGGLPYGTTRDELWERFKKFGPIEKISVHLRVGNRDNYGFVTFSHPADARDCVEHGNSSPDEPKFDLCFGGRRQFCGGSYVDFDSTTSHLEELHETYGDVYDSMAEDDDFDALLRMCQKQLNG